MFEVTNSNTNRKYIELSCYEKCLFQVKLEANDQYTVVVNLEKKLQELVEENEKLQRHIDNSLGLGNYQVFKTSALEEVKLIFEELKSKLQK